MGYLLFILFVAFLILGLWRAVAVTLSVHEGHKIDFHLSRGIPFFVRSALILVFWLSFTTIDAGYRGVVLRFGALTGRTLEPGPHLIIPVFETVKPISVQVQVEKLDSQAAAKALEVQKQQITPELIELRTIEMMQSRWDGRLPDVYMAGNGGSALPMIDVLKTAGRTK